LHVREAAIKKNSTCETGQTSEPISATRLPWGIVAIRWNEEKKQ
jgi:hypothetical protein